VGSGRLYAVAAAVRAAAREWEPSVVYAHQNLPGMAALLARTGVPIVADFHSLPSREWLTTLKHAPARQRPAAAINAAKAWPIELFLVAGAHHLVAAGVELADDLVAAYPTRQRPTVISNGVDPAFLESQRGITPFGGQPEARHVVAVIPSSSAPANVVALKFLRECASIMSTEDQPIVFHVLGSRRGPGDDGLVYHGTRTQPALKPWVAHADACLLPYPPATALRGGARNKLLEALAGGRRVVTTMEGLRGLPEARDWPGVFVAPDTPAEFGTVVRDAVSADAPTLTPQRDLSLNWDALAEELAAAFEAVLDSNAER